MTSNEPSRRSWIVAVLIVGPALVLAHRTGSRIAAEREADKIVRTLASIGPDGRPDPRALAHVERGSGALIEVLCGLVREGPFENRAAIARALGFSRRLECLRELVLELRDGCIAPELVALPRAFPCAAYPPDELALEAGEAGLEAMSGLAKDEDPFVRGFAHEHLVAQGKRSIDGELVGLLDREGVLGDRAGALLVSHLDDPKPPVALDGAPGLLAIAAPTPRGRVAAALLARSGLAGAREGEIRSLAGCLSSADRTLVRDPHATARAERALARGDAGAAALLGELADVDSGARAALVAAVSSADSPAVREAARRALASH